MTMTHRLLLQVKWPLITVLRSAASNPDALHRRHPFVFLLSPVRALIHPDARGREPKRALKSRTASAAEKHR